MVCGRQHQGNLAEMLRAARHEVAEADLTAERWYSGRAGRGGTVAKMPGSELPENLARVAAKYAISMFSLLDEIWAC